MSLLDNGTALTPTTINDPLVSGTLSLWTQTYVIPVGDGGLWAFDSPAAMEIPTR
jgi:hypothetical protein